jgi:elongation factor G
MPTFDMAKFRNVALLSHSGAGKTAICEAALFQTKAITRQGRIEDGNTFSDYELEEVQRGASVQTSPIPCHWNEFKINILDTPRYDDFADEVTSALRVTDNGVMVIAATAGVELGTERAQGMCEEAGMPGLMFINRMDRDNADFFRCVEQAQATFGRRCIPLQVSIGAQQEFNGVVDVLNPPKDTPHQIASEVQSARERLLKAVAETDNNLATKYLNGEDLTDAEMLDASQKAIPNREIAPIWEFTTRKRVDK